jgi:hypothetical protein
MSRPAPTAAAKARVENALRELPLTEADIATAAAWLLRHNLVLTAKPLSADSTFFDFRDKVAAVVGRFARDGLTQAAYLKAAVRQPALFYQAPATIIGNVEGVVERFAADGLTRPAYLRTALRLPPLFSCTPATIIGNVERLAECFRPHGLTAAAYLRAALKCPALLSCTPDTVRGNVEGVVGHFAADGLTLDAYLRAVLRQPPLLTVRPATVISRVEEVVRHFASHGLTLAAYLRAALRQPSLLTLTPETVIGNVEEVAGHFAAHGLTLAAYLRAALRQPQLFCQSPATLRANIEGVAEHFAPDGLTLKAIASGNPAVLTLAEADAELQRLSVLKKNHADEQYLARRSVRDLPESIGRLSQRLASLTADQATLTAHAGDPLTIGSRGAGRDEAMGLLAQALDHLPTVREERRVPLGIYRGLAFGLVLHPQFAPELYLEGAIRRQGRCRASITGRAPSSTPSTAWPGAGSSASPSRQTRWKATARTTRTR